MSQVLSFRARGRAGLEVAAPQDFVRQVADALAHLHDVPHLQTHPLSRRLASRGGSTEGLGRALQQALLDAIEGLRSARRSPPPERSGRVHRLLVLRHIDGLEPAAVWGQLGIGKSEYYREHSRGIDAVASLLFDQLNSGDRSARVEPPVDATATHEPPPHPLSSFVGRERELVDVEELLGRARLVTLTGPPGTGKTRLALQIAERIQPAFAHGVVFVALAAIGHPDLVLPTVAQTLRLPEETGRTALDLLVRALSARELLLVLDNFEHVVSASPQLSALLGACPRLRVLVTSRELLRITGEHAYAVAPLNDPEAVQLFADRARATRGDFALTAENSAAV